MNNSIGLIKRHRWLSNVFSIVLIVLLGSCAPSTTVQPLSSTATGSETTVTTLTPQKDIETATPTNTLNPTETLTPTNAATITPTATPILNAAYLVMALGIPTTSDGNFDFDTPINRLPTIDGRNLRDEISKKEQLLMRWVQIKRNDHPKIANPDCKFIWIIQDMSKLEGATPWVNLKARLSGNNCLPDDTPGAFEAAFRVENIDGGDGILAFYRADLENGDFILIKAFYTREYFEHPGSQSTLHTELFLKHFMPSRPISLEADKLYRPRNNAQALNREGLLDTAKLEEIMGEWERSGWPVLEAQDVIWPGNGYMLRY